MTHIDYSAKTDRELLLLVAQNTNTLTEQRIPQIEDDIAKIKEDCKKRAEACAGMQSSGSLFQNKDLLKGAGLGGSPLAIYFVVKAILAQFGVTI